MTMDDSQPLVVWAIRLTPRAQADLAAAWGHLATSAGEEIADAWNAGLKSEMSTLAQLPERAPLARENYFSKPVHKFLYRRTPRGPAYYVLFALEMSPDDAPTLRVMHIRHGARPPITRKEAREIEASE